MANHKDLGGLSIEELQDRIKTLRNEKLEQHKHVSGEASRARIMGYCDALDEVLHLIDLK